MTNYSASSTFVWQNNFCLLTNRCQQTVERFCSVSAQM